MISIDFFVFISAVMFSIGLFGILTRRNVVGVLMSIELILNAANINLVAFHKYFGSDAGQIFAFFVICIAAIGSVVGLVLVIAIYRSRESIFTDDFDLMKW